VNGHKNNEKAIEETDQDDFGGFEDANEDLDDQFFDTTSLLASTTGDVIVGEISSKEISASISDDTSDVDNVDTQMQVLENKKDETKNDGLDAVTNQEDDSDHNNNIQGTASNDDTIDVTQPRHVQQDDAFFGDLEAVKMKEGKDTPVDETHETFGYFADALPQGAGTEPSTETTVAGTKSDNGAFGCFPLTQSQQPLVRQQGEEETSNLQTAYDTQHVSGGEDNHIDGNDKNAGQFVGTSTSNTQEHDDESTGGKEMNRGDIDDKQPEVPKTNDPVVDDTSDLGDLDKVEKTRKQLKILTVMTTMLLVTLIPLLQSLKIILILETLMQLLHTHRGRQEARRRQRMMRMLILVTLVQLLLQMLKNLGSS
jgi:hypothetical protein